MQRNDLLDKYTFNTSKLLNYGFKLVDNTYCLQRKLNINNMFIIIKINSQSVNINIYDEDSYIYLPFERTDSFGSFVSEVRKKANLIIQDIVNKCCVINSLKDPVLKYCQETLPTKIETPWTKYPDYYTLKTIPKNKWYGVIMTVPYKTLGLSREGLVDIINLKNNPSKIISLIDNKIYFKAYHMNKKYWYTIILTNNTNLSKLKKLIQESYSLIESPE